MEASRHPRAGKGDRLCRTGKNCRVSPWSINWVGKNSVTVMIDAFFGMHPHLVRSGLWRKLKPGEKDLYVYLMEESERCCTREIRVTDAQVREGVGAAPRTLCNARKKLKEYGLIHFKAGQGNRYTYIICNPKTGLPYPGDPHTPMVMPRRRRTMGTELPGNGVMSPPSKALDTPKSSPDGQGTPESYGLPGIF
jgi:hypothetical protein